MNKYTSYMVYSVQWGGGGGLLLETKFCRCFNTLYLTRLPDSEPTKMLDHPRQKFRRGGGLRQINTCLIVPFCIASYESYGKPLDTNRNQYST